MPWHIRVRHAPSWRLPCASLLLVVACNRSATDTLVDVRRECSIPQAFIADGGPGVDGIPALTDPQMVSAGAAGTEYLLEADRVIGIEIDGASIAIPLNIGWWHEVVNLNRGARQLLVTHCPLTGSSLVFDRAPVGGAAFGVSGLLYLNNLMMYDRSSPSSLWPQMARGARCGSRTGTNLPLYPSVEMTWAGWRTLHPSTQVVSSATGYARDYRAYPYGSYAVEGNPQLLAPIPKLDSRRPPKERVLGIVLGDSVSAAVPFGLLRTQGTVAVARVALGSRSAIVFWDGAREAASAFAPEAGGVAFTFHVTALSIRDDQTGSTWTVDGRAVAGPLAGSRLTQIEDSFVAYWFAWAAFYPATAIWSGS